MVADIPDILYSVINEIGKDKIRQEMASDIRVSGRYSRQIMQEARMRLGASDPESIGTLCEALLHFMLTSALLPSQRKLSIRGIDVDVVIPSSRILLHDADKALVIQVLKSVSDPSKIKNAEALQPFKDNIWLISANRFPSNYRNYNLADDSYHELISDIQVFVSSKGISGLKLLQGE